jgi:DNA-binding transcriptional regulator YdaS (Cro superfamily)
MAASEARRRLIFSQSVDPAPIRGAIAAAGVHAYLIAADIGRHPCDLSRRLRGREPLSPELAEAIMRAVEARRQRAEAGR